MKKRYLPILLLITISGCVNREAQKQAKVTEKILSDPVQLVEIYEAKPEKFTENLTVKGTVVAPEDTNISSKIAGKVLRIYVKEGERINVNQILAVLESNELKDSLRNSEAQVRSAAAALEKAKINSYMSAPKNDAAIQSAQAQLVAAQVSLKKAKTGGRQQEKLQAQATLNASKSSLDIAEKKAERYEKLYQAEAISLQDLEGAQNAYQLALAQHEQSKETLSMSGSAREEDINAAEQQVIIAEQALRSALISKKLDDVSLQDVNIAESAYRSAIAQRSLSMQALKDAVIRAPFSGHISGKSVSAGTVVSPGTSLMRLTSSGNYYIEAEISEKDFRILNIGSKCTIKVPALSNHLINGRLAGINPNLETVGRLFNARIDFSDNVKGLFPGMYAETQISLKDIPSAWLIPSEAIINDSNGTHVFLVSDNVVHRKEIQIGKRWGNRVEVIGISLGDRIVVKGQNNLTQGTKVREQK